MVKPADYSASGAAIYKYEEKERAWTPPDFGEEGWVDKILEHVERQFGEVESVFHEVVSDLIHVDVHWIKPTPEQNFHTFFTTGMSFKPMHVPEGYPDYRFAELLVLLPASWPITQAAFQNDDNYWPIYWLKKLARFPHEYDSSLAIGHTIPNGDPAKPLSRQTKQSGIILLPTFGVSPEFHVLEMDDERKVRFYCLYPLYKEEMDYKLNHGYDALLEKLFQQSLNQVIDVKRDNVCKKPSWKFW